MTWFSGNKQNLFVCLLYYHKIKGCIHLLTCALPFLVTKWGFRDKGEWNTGIKNCVLTLWKETLSFMLCQFDKLAHNTLLMVNLNAWLSTL